MVVVTRDLDGRLTFCNDYFISLTGWEREAILGRGWWEVFVPPECRGADNWFLQHAREGAAHPHEETPILVPGGRRLISWSHTVVLDARGTAIGVTSIGQDVTDQRREEERLREAETKYRNLVEQIPAVTYLDALHGCATSYVSPQYERLFGYTPEERIADREMWSRLLHPDDRERALAESDRSDRTGQPFRLEYRMVARDGRVVWVHDEAYLVENEEGERLFWQGVLFDITERMEREHRVRQAEAKYRSLVEQMLHRTVQAQEEERERVALEFHDGLGQILTSISLFASDLHEEVGAESKARAMRVHELALRAIADCRRLVWSLRPPELERLGLVPALRRLADEVSVPDLTVDLFEEIGDLRLEPESEAVVYRVVQEAVHNAQKHAGASAILILLQQQDGQLRMLVEDNGRGFDPAAVQPGRGLGLTGMRERAEMVRGALVVESAPHAGTRVRLVVPVGAPPITDEGDGSPTPAASR